MNMLIIGCLVASILYVASRLHVSRTENSQLRVHIAALKRQLSRRGP